MTATPNFASGAGAEAGGPAAPALSAGPFVLNLCSSTSPMALAQTDLPELKRFTFFVSRRFEEGRERFRLHMGYFATLAEAEEWLGLVRDIYPGAWAGETPGRKLRERATAAAAAQAQHAAGPQPQVEAPAARAPVAMPAPRPTARPLVTPPAPMRVPVVHAALPVARAAAPVLSPSSVRPPARQPPVPPRTTTASAASQRAAPVPRAAAPAARPAARIIPPAKAAPAASMTRAAPRAPAASRPAKGGTKPVFEDSNVREVLKALGDAGATGETRLMRAPPPPREPPA